MLKVYVAGVALLAAFASGAVISSSWVHGQYARKELAEKAATEQATRELRAQEIERLRNEAAMDLNMGIVVDETYSDPDASLPSLGLRDAERLNRIR